MRQQSGVGRGRGILEVELMISEKQAEANRRNALQSTGPKSAEGIEAARFNALRHLKGWKTVRGMVANGGG